MRGFLVLLHREQMRESASLSAVSRAATELAAERETVAKLKRDLGLLAASHDARCAEADQLTGELRVLRSRVQKQAHQAGSNLGTELAAERQARVEATERAQVMERQLLELNELLSQTTEELARLTVKS
jgi:chromosome segregation ATPase